MANINSVRQEPQARLPVQAPVAKSPGQAPQVERTQRGDVLTIEDALSIRPKAGAPRLIAIHL